MRHGIRTAHTSEVSALSANRNLFLEERTGGLWGETVDPKDEGLKAAALIIGRNAAEEIRTVVNVNNHYEGCAPLTIQRFLRLV